MTTLYLIRHAKADERGPHYPDDSKRPLIDKGFKQAQTLARVFKKLEIQFDSIVSSPYTRAMQTAQPLEACLKTGKIQYLDTLTGSNYPALLEEIKTKNSKVVAAVGHEPYLSEFATFLLAKSNVSIAFKKSAFMVLSGELEAWEMTLDMFVPYSIYKKVISC